LNITFITVGTSGLTNDVGRAPDDRDNSALKSEIERFFGDPKRQESRFSRLRSDLIDAHLRYWQASESYTNNPKHFLYTSAELTSTVFLLRSLEYCMDRLVLLSSDTEEGWFAAGVNEEVLRTLFPDTVVERRRIPSLDVHFKNTQASLAALLDEYRLRADDHVIMNVTGGFKGTIAFLTLFAQKNGWEMYFQHETRDSAALLHFERSEGQGVVRVTEWKPWMRWR